MYKKKEKEKKKILNLVKGHLSWLPKGLLVLRVFPEYSHWRRSNHWWQIPSQNSFYFVPPFSLTSFICRFPRAGSKAPSCAFFRRSVWSVWSYTCESHITYPPPLPPPNSPERGGCLRFGMQGVVIQISPQCTSLTQSGWQLEVKRL